MHEAAAARREAFRDGVRAIGTAAVGIGCWGWVTGVALVKGGLSEAQALGMVVLVYSGTAQLAALPLIAASASLAAIWTTALLANLRFVVYSATVANEFRGLPLWYRLLLGWMTTDTALAAYFGGGRGGGVVVRDPSPAERAARFVGANALVYAAWMLGAVLGVVFASLVPDTAQIAFIGELAMIALIGPMLVTRATMAAAAIAAGVAMLGAGWPWRFGMFAAIAAGVAVALGANFLDRGRAGSATGAAR